MENNHNSKVSEMSWEKSIKQAYSPVLKIFLFLIIIAVLVYLFDFLQLFVLRIIFQEIFAFGIIFEMGFFCYQIHHHIQRMEKLREKEAKKDDNT